MFAFAFILTSSILISAESNQTFTLTTSEKAITNSANQNPLSKVSTETLTQIKVTFISNPTSSDLFIDNINYGKTPKTVFLSPGNHIIRISKAGFFTANFNIVLRSGFDYTYTVRMLPGNGNPTPFFTDLRISNSLSNGLNVTFITDVSGGSGENSFYWNFGDGNTQTTISNVITHSYSHSGRYTATVTVRDLDSGLTSTSFRSFTISNISVDHLNGTLKISSIPTNATITINGVFYGQTPKSISLKPGRYTGVLSLPGYSNRTFIFMIRKDVIINIKIGLNHLKQGTLNSGVEGVIMYGPVTPVCLENASCDKAFHGNVIIKNIEKTRTIKSFFTNSDGEFKVNLEPGIYKLLVNKKFIRPCEQNITIVKDTYTDINLTCDTGIR